MTNLSEFLAKQDFDKFDKDQIPFGNPDAARALSVEELEKVGSRGFVTMYADSGISSIGSDHFRVIVGKKGSGKTLYLRRAHIFIKDQSGVYTESDEVLEVAEETRPETEQILKFSQFFNGELLTEKWKMLWRIAILRTVLTHIMFNPALSKSKEKLPRNFKTKYKKILSKAERPVTIFSQVREIIESIENSREFNKISNSIIWDELDYDLRPIIKSGPALYFFVDAIDEEYQHAPMYWLRAQKGLFYSLMQFLRDQQIGGKLHILITIRDHVYSSILSSEHETRYLDPSYISILTWDSDSAKYLLNEKVKYLSPKFYYTNGKASILENWVGVTKVNNTSRNVTEEFADYLVRHTRSIPRDIIVVGNAISNRIAEIKSTGGNFINFEEEIKKIIHHYAKRFASEQIQICSNHLTSNLMPAEAIELGIDKMYTTKYTGEQEFLNLRNVFVEKINAIIRFIGKDRFSVDELNEGREYAKKLFEIGSELNLFDILWQNGLLGYDIDDVYSKFYSERTADFKIPLTHKRYAFHSILIDHYGLEPVGKPVRIKTFTLK
jgi:hypothetical protein